jgi:hypothetical protein
MTYAGSLFAIHMKIIRPLRQEGRILLASSRIACFRSRGVVDRRVADTHYNFSEISPEEIFELQL